MPKINYIPEQKIGSLTYLRDNDIKNLENGERYAFFRCECGNEFTTMISKAKNLHTQSCGCIQKKILNERNTVHGFAKRGEKSKEYNIWIHIKRRCTNPKTKGFQYWGGAGVKICERWANSFELFFEDMGVCPENCRGIDRFPDRKGNYEPGNCRWATYLEQCNNTSRNIYIIYKGQTNTLSQWSRIINMPYSKLRYRIKEIGLSPELAFNT